MCCPGLRSAVSTNSFGNEGLAAAGEEHPDLTAGTMDMHLYGESSTISGVIDNDEDAQNDLTFGADSIPAHKSSFSSMHSHSSISQNSGSLSASVSGLNKSIASMRL